MKHFRIQIDGSAGRALALSEVSKRGRIVCFRENEFIVPEPALALLDELDVKYSLLREEDPDSALRSVRDSTAPAV